MDKKEFVRFVTALRAIYPKEKLLPDETAFELWYRLLQDIPYKIATLALQKWAYQNKWSPAISDLREVAATISCGDMPEWGEGWKQVLNAIHKFGIYQQKEALESLDSVTRVCVERLGFQELCTSENIVADRANFRMMYEGYAERRKQDAQISESMRMMIAEIQAKTNLLEDNGENGKEIC